MRITSLNKKLWGELLSIEEMKKRKIYTACINFCDPNPLMEGCGGGCYTCSISWCPVDVPCPSFRW